MTTLPRVAFRTDTPRECFSRELGCERPRIIFFMCPVTATFEQQIVAPRGARAKRFNGHQQRPPHVARVPDGYLRRLLARRPRW